jgi:hypothetical protein
MITSATTNMGGHYHILHCHAVRSISLWAAACPYTTNTCGMPVAGDKPCVQVANTQLLLTGCMLDQHTAANVVVKSYAFVAPLDTSQPGT